MENIVNFAKENKTQLIVAGSAVVLSAVLIKVGLRGIAARHENAVVEETLLNAANISTSLPSN